MTVFLCSAFCVKHPHVQECSYPALALHMHGRFVISAITKCKKGCARNAICKNVKETYICQCKRGYKGDPYKKGCKKPGMYKGPIHLYKQRSY